jgi:nucleotide-binding universal stress UspA family protein
MLALKRILVPTNLGEPSKAAIRYGVAFARQFEARLFLVHVLAAKEFDAAVETERVIETLLPDVEADSGPRTEPDQAAVIRNVAREDLGRLLDPEEERDTRAEYLLRRAGFGGPGDEILACAKELEVELLIIGKHRQSFVDHLIAGSVTERVVRQASCPVLIVHHPEHEFVETSHQAAGKS